MGRLRAISAEQGYGGTAICKSATELGLAPIGSIAVYRGFIFGRLRPTGPDLLDWLGPMRSSLDNMVDRSPDGRIEVAGGSVSLSSPRELEVLSRKYLGRFAPDGRPSISHAAGAPSLVPSAPQPVLRMRSSCR